MSRRAIDPTLLVDLEFLESQMGYNPFTGRLLMDRAEADKTSPNYQYNLLAASLASDPVLDMRLPSFNSAAARAVVKAKIEEAGEFVFNPATANQDKRDVSMVFSYFINCGADKLDNTVPHNLAEAVRVIKSHDEKYHPEPHYQNYILRNGAMVANSESSASYTLGAVPISGVGGDVVDDKASMSKAMFDRALASPYKPVRTFFGDVAADGSTASMVQGSFGGNLNQERVFIDVHLAIEHKFTQIRNGMYSALSGTLSPEDRLKSLKAISENLKEVRVTMNLLNVALSQEFFGEQMQNMLRGSEQYKSGDKIGVVDEKTRAPVSGVQGGTVAQSMMLREVDAFCGVVHTGRVADFYEHQAIGFGEKERNTLDIITALSAPMRESVAQDPEATKAFAEIVTQLHQHRISHRHLVERMIGKYVSGAGGTENPLTLLDEVNADTAKARLDWLSRIKQPEGVARNPEAQALAQGLAKEREARL